MKMTKKSGSSLLLVMIITASILVVVFGTQRLALVQFSQSARDEDNQVAYYAAKSGIEDGLLRYRYNRDAETVTTNDKDYQWFNITSGIMDAKSYVDNDKPNDLDPSKQYYSIKMDYRAPTLGVISDTTGFSGWKAIGKDSLVELTGFPNENDPYFLRYKINFSDDGNSATPCYAQLQQLRTVSGGTKTTYELVKAVPDSNSLFDSRNNNLPIRTDVSGVDSLSNTVRIRAVGCDIKFAAQTVTSSSGVSLANVDFDSLTTTITSTGYYGASKRTLVATIDRVSGTLLGVYDMTLYGGNKVGR